MSAFISFANLHCPSISSAAIGLHSANFLIPGLPGATISFFVNGDLNNDKAIACSRPPPPTTKIFIYL